MNPDGVRQQIEGLIERLVAASISVKQFYPSIKEYEGGLVSIGRQMSGGIALRDIAYENVYRDLELNEAYDVKLVDGGLLLFQYKFDGNKILLQHRLAYFPSPVLPTIEEAPSLYENDELYGDIIARRIVRFPVRFDYAPDQKVDVLHPASHMTLGQYESCRIPVTGPLTPNAFGMFIVRNFYCRAYIKHKNKFDRRMLKLSSLETISEAERRISHLVSA